MKNVSVVMKEELYRKVNTIAHDNRVSMSQIIRNAVNNYISENEIDDDKEIDNEYKSIYK